MEWKGGLLQVFGKLLHETISSYTVLYSLMKEVHNQVKYAKLHVPYAAYAHNENQNFQTV